MSSRWTSAALLGLIGCGPAEPPDRPTLPTTTTPGADCAQPLVLTSEHAAAPSRGSMRLFVTGGSSDQGFAMDAAPSGGTVSASTGSYAAGPVAGVTDRVRVDDLACGTSATVEIEVVPPLEVRPRQAVVVPETGFRLDVSGGSGEVSCAAEALGSGGSVQHCAWSAGAAPGVDVITVSDLRTGEVRTARYTVDPSAAFRLWGRRVLLAQGQPFELRFTAGTQLVALEGLGASLDYTDGVLTGLVEGSYQLAATDSYATDLRTVFQVDVAAPRTAPPLADGERSHWAHVTGADFDADGFADVVVGWSEGSVSAHFGGAASIYRGGPQGLSEVPDWTVGGTQQYAFAGRSIGVGDLNGDGVPDLAVGVDGAHTANGTYTGRVDVHYGVAGALPSATPGQSLIGEWAGDRLGSSMAICDVDGDGHDDLAVGGYGIEDRTVSPLRSTEGAVHVWRGGPRGVWGPPTWRLYGRQLGALMGRQLVGGDVDGDGLCDLVAGSFTARLTGHDPALGDGVLWLFEGDEIQSGRLDAERHYVCDLVDTSCQFGKALAMGDVDGDGHDDVIAGAWTADHPLVSSGAAWVFLEADHDGGPVWSTAQASATVVGRTSYAYAGIGVHVGAQNLWVASGYDEDPGGVSNAGVVRGYPRALVRGDLTDAEATEAREGVNSQGFLGQAVAEVGDVNGDGVVDLAVVAARDSAFGIETGALYVFDGQEGEPAASMLPDLGSGDHLGTRNAVALLATEGSDAVDLVAGAWGRAGGSYDEGAAFRWTDGVMGWDGVVSQEVAGLEGQGAADRIGVAVTSAGDFDGDGAEDLVVVGQFDDRPSAFASPPFANPDACPGSLTSSGSAWVLGAGKEPRFWLHGYAYGDRLDAAAGGFDHNGDGWDDLVVGSAAYGAEGGFSLAYGRPGAAGGLIEVICDARHWLGVSAASRLGAAMTGVGDVDGDGCDEFAVGAEADDLGRTNQGSVRVMWGFGPACARAEPEVTTVVSAVAGDGLGYALAGGRDVDGDGAPDLVVSAITADPGQGHVGAVWLLSGRWLAGRPRQPADTLPGDNATIASVAPRTHRAIGDLVDADFGSAVALMPAPGHATASWVVVGQRRGAVSGVEGSGGAVVLGWTDLGFELEPVALIGGESASSLLGWGLAARHDASVLAIGAPLSDVSGLDNGAVYPFRLK